MQTNQGGFQTCVHLAQLLRSYFNPLPFQNFTSHKLRACYAYLQKPSRHECVTRQAAKHNMQDLVHTYFHIDFILGNGAKSVLSLLPINDRFDEE